MSEHNFHIAIKGTNPKKVRHYKWVSIMYQFVLRNQRMFKDKTLTVYDFNRPVAHITFAEIQKQMTKQDNDYTKTEKDYRKELFSIKNLEEEM